jgi:hypothetical protein
MIPHTGEMEDAHVRARLGDRLTALGPFFAADTHASHTPPTAPWRNMAGLLDDPAVLAGRVHTARASLAAGSGQDSEAVELRVAASVVHLGLAARVLSPLLALAVLHGRTAPVSLRDLRWQPEAPGVFPLSIADLDDMPQALGATTTTAMTTNPEALVDAFARNSVRTIADELCSTTRALGVSEHVLRGNITSALVGACGVLGTARPDERPRVQAALACLLSHPVLVGTTQTSLDGRFQRRSCCLIYRAAPGRNGMICGDCVLLGTRRRAG